MILRLFPILGRGALIFKIFFGQLFNEIKCLHIPFSFTVFKMKLKKYIPGLCLFLKPRKRNALKINDKQYCLVLTVGFVHVFLVMVYASLWEW